MSVALVFGVDGGHQHKSAAVTVNLPAAEQYSPLNVVMSASCGTRVQGQSYVVA